jgi:zinc protease
MRITKLIFCGALAVSVAIGQTKPVASYKGIKYPPLHNVKVPEPLRYELANGMVVFILEDHELPTFGASAMIHTGGRLVPAEKVGLGGITGSVMRTGGTTTRSGDELDKLLDRLGASVETGIQADAGTAFISSLKEDSDTALSILSDVMRNPAFPEDKIALAKTQVLDSIGRRNEDSHGIVQREFSHVIYGKGSPYGRQPEYDTVNAITREDLVQFHHKYFQPENVILGVWGDFKTADMKLLIEKEFGSWPRGGMPKPEVPSVDPAARNRSGVYVIDKDDVNQSEVLVGALGGKRSDPDYYANVVTAQILGGGFGSRLLNRIRTDEGLAYSTFASWGAQYDHPGTYLAGAGTKSGTTIKAIGLIKEELKKMGEAEPKDLEFQRAKDFILKGQSFDFDSTAKIVERLMTYEYSGYPLDTLKKFNENIAKVTKADVLRVAKQYWQPEKMAIVILGKSADFDQPPSSLGPVTNIDITIPKPKSAQVGAATDESMAKGKTLLAKARQAMGGDKLASVRNVVQKYDLIAVTPQGEMALKAESTHQSGKSLEKITTPMGEMLQGYDGQKAWMKTPGGVQDAPPAAAKMAKDELDRDLVSLLANSPKLNAQALGASKLEGKDVEGLLVTDPATKMEVKLFVDPATGLVAGRSYVGAMMGAPGELQETYLEYKDVNGIKFPSHAVVSQNGSKRAEIKVNDVAINTEIADSVFAKP